VDFELNIGNITWSIEAYGTYFIISFIPEEVNPSSQFGRYSNN